MLLFGACRRGLRYRYGEDLLRISIVLCTLVSAAGLNNYPRGAIKHCYQYYHYYYYYYHLCFYFNTGTFTAIVTITVTITVTVSVSITNAITITSSTIVTITITVGARIKFNQEFASPPGELSYC